MGNKSRRTAASHLLPWATRRKMHTASLPPQGRPRWHGLQPPSLDGGAKLRISNGRLERATCDYAVWQSARWGTKRNAAEARGR